MDLLQPLNAQEKTAVESFARSFGLANDSLNLIHRGEGFVFEARRGPQPVILKVTISAQDASPWLQSQLDWIHTLRSAGLVVPELFVSKDGGWIDCLELAGVFYTAHAYQAILIGPRNTIDWRDPAMPVLVGETMGKMHRLARGYQPPPGCLPLGEGDQADWLQHPEQALHPSQATLFEPIARLREALTRLPRTAGAYGLIHDDFHTGNIFHIDGQIAVIDFGCCHCSWFAKDLSSALLFRVWITPEKEALTGQAVDFLQKLIQGYRRQAPFQPEWLSMFPILLKLRELSLFQSFYRQVDRTQAGHEPLFSYLFESIRDNRAFLEIDFESI